MIVPVVVTDVYKRYNSAVLGVCYVYILHKVLKKSFILWLFLTINPANVFLKNKG